MAETAAAGTGTTTVAAGASGTTVIPGQSTGGPSGVQNAGPVVVPPGAGADWAAALPDEMKAYVTNKGFKDPAMVLESYRNLEKLQGVKAENLLKLPDTQDAPEWASIYDRLGRPKTAAEYTFSDPDPKSGLKGNPEFKDWAQKNFHELGLTKAQGEKLAAKWNEFAIGDVQKQTAAYQSNLKIEDGALKREWGAAYEQNLRAGSKAMQQFGLSTDDVSNLEKTFGYSKTLKFLSSIGSKLGEGSFHSGDQTTNGFGGAMTPDQARGQIDILKQDKGWVEKYLNGDSDAKQKLQRLMEFAYPGAQDAKGFSVT